MIPIMLMALDLSSGYAGARACAGCHSEQYARQAKSHHAQALHRGSEAGTFPFLRSDLVHETPDSNSASFEFRKTTNELSVTISLGQERAKVPVDWIFGA